MYQVMIVDDEKMVVNSLALGFDWKSRGFEVVATSTSSREAMEMIEFIRPDIACLPTSRCRESPAWN